MKVAKEAGHSQSWEQTTTKANTACLLPCVDQYIPHSFLERLGSFSMFRRLDMAPLNIRVRAIRKVC